MNEYQKLFDYYKECFSFVNKFHFNSELTKSVFKRHVSVQDSETIPITHAGIQDNRQKKYFNSDCIRLAFIGNLTPYKGFPLLLRTLEHLYVNGIRNWSLDVWSNKKEDSKGLPVEYKGLFHHDQIVDVYNGIDLLIVPSICNETFSLVTLEALSYGVPVLVSDHVGAKILVEQYNKDFIFHGEEELFNTLANSLQNVNSLISYNDRILSVPWNHNMIDHTLEIINKLYKQ